MTWKHDDLAADLAQFKIAPGRMVWTDMQLGPSGSPRPDVYTIEKSYSNPKPTVYEIKVSRSDFLSDIKSGKYLKYFDFAQQVYFAVPDGLVKKSEIPDNCGLAVRKQNVWRNTKRATVQPYKLPETAVLKLLIDGVHRTTQRSLPKPRNASAFILAQKIRQKFGDDVATAVLDIGRSRNEIDFLKAELARTKAEQQSILSRTREIQKDARERGLREISSKQALLDDAINELCDLLGVEQRSIHALRRSIRFRFDEINRDKEVKDLRGALKIAHDAIEKAINTPASKEVK